MYIKKVLLLFLVLFVLIACDKNAILDKNKKIHNAEWHFMELKKIETEITDTISGYNLYINVRHTIDYQYSNLYVFMTTYFPNNTIARDTIEIPLANEKGAWYGQGWGKNRYLKMSLGNNISFPYIGLYTFEIEQAMRTEILNEISEIGLRIEKNN